MNEPLPPPPNPFARPGFLPAVCFGMALWFGYDGWFNPEMEWVNFNRGGFVVSVVLGAFFLWRMIKERGADDPPS